MNEAMIPKTLYDVVIYQRSTRQVERVMGTNLERYDGFYNAEKSCEIALMQITYYSAVAIVPAGRYGKGDVLPEEIGGRCHTPGDDEPLAQRSA